MKKRVVVAMSGGVDSSTVAAILKDEGYEVIGMHLQFWSDSSSGESAASELARNKCCTLEGLEDARAVAAHLNIPFYVMNVVQEFKETVVDHFLDAYSAGQTPNPCIECNREIKFGELLSRARELDADFLATGHYAKVGFNKGSGQYELSRAADSEKDQSYFLYHLTQEKLAHILFPLGDFTKPEVYELAKKYALPRVIEKPQSQGLCFFAESKPLYFLKRHLGKNLFKPGPIVTVDGREIGLHKGLPFYTIGQRQGLGIGGIKGEPEGVAWYVVQIDVEKNRLIVGREKDLENSAIVCGELEFISGTPPTAAMDISVSIRYRAKPVAARLTLNNNSARVFCEKTLRGISPGQSAVFYEGEKIIGGGIIEGAYEKKSFSTEGPLSIAH